jgi:hypothetical protein
MPDQRSHRISPVLALSAKTSSLPVIPRPVHPQGGWWAMRDHMRAELTIAALTMAIQRRRPGAGLIHHSDRGRQGGINRSSQHNREEYCDGRERAVGSSVTGQVEVARAAGDGAT